MKRCKYILSILFLILIGAGNLSAQQTDEEKKAMIKEARKIMKSVESELKKNGSDQEAVRLMETAKAKSDYAYSYMISLPGYEAAVLSQTAKEFKAKVKAEDETYKTLRKDAREAQRKKQDYVSGINEDYKNALASHYELMY